MWERLVTWAYKKSDFCIFQLEDARDFFPDDVRKHSFVIPNPYIPVKTNIESTPERKKTIVSVGRFVQQKGYDVLISAFSEVYKKHPDYKLVLFGDGPLKTTYDEQVKTLGIDDAVVFPGYSDNPTESIMNEGIFVLSSRFEGIPNSLIEAMAVGVPTVSTDCPSGGPRFLSDDGKRSILVPINDSKRLENAINKIIETPQLAEELSRKGMEIREVLNEEIIRKQWIDTFKSMLVLTN
jgi:glycosyltransferase involved in cell wall biosynthesis